MKRKVPKIINGIEYWECSVCHKWLDAANFYSEKRRPSGLKCLCKQCFRIELNATRDKISQRTCSREWHRKNRKIHPEKYRESNRKWRLHHYDRKSLKARARIQLNLAIIRGEITRPLVCDECGATGMIEAHHGNYNDFLKVQWLCKLCHGIKHWKENEGVIKCN